MSRYERTREARMPTEQRIGEHVVRIEHDGVLVIVFRGDITAAEMRSLLEVHDGQLKRDGDLFVLSDLRLIGNVAPGARHALGNREKGLPGYCSAYLVANFRTRILMDLLLKAASLISQSRIVHRFFDSEPDALAWLRQARASRKPNAA